MIKLSYQLKSTIKLQLACSDHAGWVCAEAFLQHLTELYLSFPHSSGIASASLCCRVRCCFLPLSREHPDPRAGRPLRTNTIMQSLTTTCFLKTYVSNYFNNAEILIYRLNSWYRFIRFTFQNIPSLNVWHTLPWNCTCKQCTVRRVWE